MRAIAVTVSAMLLAGCGGEALPAEIAARYRVAHVAGLGGAQAMAIYRNEAAALPDLDQFAIVVNGRPLTDRTSAADPNTFYLLSGSLARALPGASYEFVLDLPSARGTRSAIEMVEPAELTSPAPQSTLSLDEDLEVAWSSSMPGQIDQVYLRIFGPGVHLSGYDESDTAVAESGEARVTIPSSQLRRWVAALELAKPVPAPPGLANAQLELVLARSHRASTRPPFQSGEIEALAEISTIAVALAP
jgi:hypothetical protein